MSLAIKLALKGEGKVAPNPLVGAVIVRKNKIIGRGYHQYFGGPHSEINAINSVKNPEHLKGATLYLTLEPCSHFGKTPPCADAIAYSGISKVVIASRDPNPLVRGRGVRLLKQHGINVIGGVLAKEARAINKPFFKAHQKGIPYVIAKWAMSMDAKMAYPNGKPKWITSKESRDYAKVIRGRCQAVMVGIETALEDNPFLLPQMNSAETAIANADKRRKPIRIILDSKARLPSNSNLIRTIGKGDVYLMVSASAPRKRIVALEKKGVRVFRVAGRLGKLDFMAAMRTLAKSGIQKIMIEGGADVLKSAFDNKVVDEVYCFVAPKVIGCENTLSAIGFLKKAGPFEQGATVKDMGSDILLHGYV
ncbi:MAG: bifunctional diaminohydroxyphosphoribosylaminopyrimidine deaminase/5-amino-6-(5-phosphoribosylamino)uracil reductase RibD [Planctomycetota bacterium]